MLSALALIGCQDEKKEPCAGPKHPPKEVTDQLKLINDKIDALVKNYNEGIGRDAFVAREDELVSEKIKLMKFFPDVCGVPWFLVYSRYKNFGKEVDKAIDTDDATAARTYLRNARVEKDDLRRQFQRQNTVFPEPSKEDRILLREFDWKLGDMDRELDKLIKALDAGVKPEDFVSRTKQLDFHRAFFVGSLPRLYGTSFYEAFGRLRAIDRELAQAVDAIYEGKDPVPDLQSAKKYKDKLRDQLLQE